MDDFAKLKQMQREGWATFQPFENITCRAAPHLIHFAGIKAGARVLDIGCGTGVAAITAAREGAKVSGVDLTPELIERAKENASIGQVEVDFQVGDAEAIPFGDATFDVVISQFGHMFAPRADVTISEMLRVLKPGGTIAFSTWPPHLFTGRMFALTGKYAPPPPPGVTPPPVWGDPHFVRERLGDKVRDIRFSGQTIHTPAISPQHLRVFGEKNMAQLTKLVSMLEPEKLASFRKEMDALATEYFEGNGVRQDFLMSRATKI